MIRNIAFFFCACFIISTSLLGITSCKEVERQAVITTNFGDITVLLYNSTPKHRDNFIKLVEQSYYDDLLFHRVIDHFMIQGGDPNSKNAGMDAQLGSGDPGYELEPEIGAPHLRGALAAARTPNAAKLSSGSQFYIVTGLKQTDQQLDAVEQRMGFKYNDEQRRIYKEEGGHPNLDMEYTVFGEVVSGMEVVEQISKVEKNERDRPLSDVRMKIKMIK